MKRTPKRPTPGVPVQRLPDARQLPAALLESSDSSARVETPGVPRGSTSNSTRFAAALQESIARWCLAATLLLTATVAAAGEVEAVNALLRVRDRADVPARDRGVLEELPADAGQLLDAGQLVGRLDTLEQRLAREAAKIDLNTARLEREVDMAAEIAAVAVDEARQRLEQATAAVAVARKQAESDVAVRQAENLERIAQEELDRTLATRERFASAVSQLEVARLRADRDTHRLEGEAAQHTRAVDTLKVPQLESTVAENEQALRKASLQEQDAVRRRPLLDLAVERLAKQLEIADAAVKRREVRSPLAGLVVERVKQPGEWVEPGETVVRVVGLDRLYVEGYADAAAVSGEAVGRPARVRVAGRDTPVPAVVTFVSPDIDAINQQVLVRAALDNPDRSLRPGEKVRFTIDVP